METTLGKANCIVLTPKPEQVNEELKQLLEARNWHVRQTNVPLLALSDLCLLERTQASRSAWGLSRCEGVALIVVDPDNWPELQAMLGAIAQYLPIVSIWSFENGKLQCVSQPIENNQPHDKEFENVPVIEHDDDVTDLHISGDELTMLLDIEDQENQS